MSLQAILLVVMLAGVFSSISLGIPVMFSLLAVPLCVASIGVLGGVFEPALLGALPSRIYGIMGNQLLYSVPLFVLMGKILEHAGIAERMLVSTAALFKNRSRSIVFAVLLVSVLIASSTGIVGATITMLAAIALPAMLRSGITERLASGLICAAGSLGQILPPSIVLILLSDQVSSAYVSAQRSAGNYVTEPVSVGHLFAGAIIPGLLLAAAYGLYLFLKSGKDNGAAAETKHDRVFENETEIRSLYSLAGLLLLLCVPLSIITGIAGVTEVAALGVFITLVLAISGGAVSRLLPAFRETVEITGIIFGIVIAASMFSLVFRGLGGDGIATGFLTQVSDNATIALLLVMLLVFLLGFIIEFVEITYIVVPVAAPALFLLGVDPVWFAMLMAVNLQISFLTPPLGIALFYFKSVTAIKTTVLYRSILPFVLIQIAILGLLFLFPALATWLPSVLI